MRSHLPCGVHLEFRGRETIELAVVDAFRCAGCRALGASGTASKHGSSNWRRPTGSSWSRIEEIWKPGPSSRDRKVRTLLRPFIGSRLLNSEPGKPNEAEPLYQRALNLWEKTLGPECEEVAGCCSNLAIVYLEQRRFEEAEPLFKRALAIREKVLGADHPEVVQQSHSILASHYFASGNPAEAKRLTQRASEIENACNSNHGETKSCDES